MNNMFLINDLTPKANCFLSHANIQSTSASLNSTVGSGFIPNKSRSSSRRRVTTLQSQGLKLGIKRVKSFRGIKRNSSDSFRVGTESIAWKDGSLTFVDEALDSCYSQFFYVQHQDDVDSFFDYSVSSSEGSAAYSGSGIEPMQLGHLQTEICFSLGTMKLM